MDIFCGLFGKPEFKDIDDLPRGYKKIGTYGDEVWYEKYGGMKTSVEEINSNIVYLKNTDTMKTIRDIIKKDFEYKRKNILPNTVLIGSYDETAESIWVKPLIIETKHLIRISWITINR